MTMKLVVVVFSISLSSVLLWLPSVAFFTTVSLVDFHHRRLHISRHEFCDRTPFLTAGFSSAADESGDTTDTDSDDDTTSLDDEANNLNAVSWKEGQKLTEYGEVLNLAQQFIDSFMSAVVDPIPDSHGMAVVRNVLDLESGITRDIVLRSITVPFWQACIDGVNTPGFRVRVAALGTPGIGKTTTTPWLIRMLLEKHQTVVYLIRTEGKSDWYYEFVPSSDGTVSVEIYPETLKPQEIPSLRRPSTYYIVDPGQSKDNCNPPTRFAAKVILVPSPDSRHWGESDFEKQRGDVVGEFRYFPTWSYKELLVARPIFSPSMTEDQLLERFRQFGGVPRHIFERKVKGRLQAQDRAVNALTPEQGNWLALGQMNALDTFGKEAKSALLAFRLSDDDYGTFENGEPYIVSDLAFEKIYSNFQSNFWNVMLQRGPSGGGGFIFEVITRHMIAKKGPLREFEGRLCVGKKEVEVRKNVFNLKLGTGNRKIRQVTDPVVAAAEYENVVFYPINSNNKLFDFLYKNSSAHFHIFQATIGQSHKANVTHIKELEGKVGDASKMSFYFLVPSENFADFVTDPVQPNVDCNVYHVSIPKQWAEQSEVTVGDGDGDWSRADDSENGRDSPPGATREATDSDGDDQSGGGSSKGRKSPRGAKGKKL